MNALTVTTAAVVALLHTTHGARYLAHAMNPVAYAGDSGNFWTRFGLVVAWEVIFVAVVGIAVAAGYGKKDRYTGPFFVRVFLGIVWWSFLAQTLQPWLAAAMQGSGGNAANDGSTVGLIFAANVIVTTIFAVLLEFWETWTRHPNIQYHKHSDTWYTSTVTSPVWKAIDHYPDDSYTWENVFQIAYNGLWASLITVDMTQWWVATAWRVQPPPAVDLGWKVLATLVLSTSMLVMRAAAPAFTTSSRAWRWSRVRRVRETVRDSFEGVALLSVTLWLSGDAVFGLASRMDNPTGIAVYAGEDLLFLIIAAVLGVGVARVFHNFIPYEYQIYDTGGEIVEISDRRARFGRLPGFDFTLGYAVAVVVYSDGVPAMGSLGPNAFGIRILAFLIVVPIYRFVLATPLNRLRIDF